jgi:hypothetical protein
MSHASHTHFPASSYVVPAHAPDSLFAADCMGHVAVEFNGEHFRNILMLDAGLD